MFFVSLLFIAVRKIDPCSLLNFKFLIILIKAKSLLLAYYYNLLKLCAKSRDSALINNHNVRIFLFPYRLFVAVQDQYLLTF